MQNEPGVLSRVSGILAGRGFNIDSLVVCRTEIRDLSRMCIVISGQDGVVEQARRQLEDLVRHVPITLPSSSLTHRCVIDQLTRMDSTGTRVGRLGLHRNAHDPARTAPRQSVHPRSRVPRRPTHRRTLSRAARVASRARRADQARSRDGPRAPIRRVHPSPAPSHRHIPITFVNIIDITVVDGRSRPRGGHGGRRRRRKAAHA